MKSVTLLAGASILAMAAAAGAQDRVVNVYNWSDYIDESILADFTAETGIKVVYDVFDSNEILETKLLAGGSGYDVVVPTGTFLRRQIQAGVFQPLQKDKLPNLSNMWPDISERLAKYDPGNDHAINYMWGTTGIGYNVAAVQERLGTDSIDSWSVVFEPETLAKFADCGVMMLDAPDEIMRAALNYLEIDPDTTEAADYEKATELLMSVRPSVQKFHSSEYINALANGDICLAVGWSGDILQARDRAAEAEQGVTVQYVIPQEGALMWFDNMAIPTDAPNVEEAHEFLNYIMRPEVAAKASNYVYYANGNLASQELLNEDVIGDPAIYPGEAATRRLYTVSPFDARLQRTVTRLWTQVRTGS
ncbi:polyamine ABC transporter substrate-binding protein [Rubrimonas cliftonensis]|uniref:Putrescine-binding periplasmic protein n=1 Tax=Rubrimonas cliftonensis TaxID=89524 RepID=A0A1H3VX51_9RHOB|nr:polyamine ABC transporter substrate-binding protein [Rubrimonas cliftonensis]SDZ79261.1 putrescine transport system substrate-binding protein [Rubrimonas cliftonensis]